MNDGSDIFGEASEVSSVSPDLFLACTVTDFFPRGRHEHDQRSIRIILAIARNARPSTRPQ